MCRAFIAATLLALHQAGDARSDTYRSVGIYCLASTHFSLTTDLSEKYNDVLQSELGDMQNNGSTGSVPYDVCIRV